MNKRPLLAAVLATVALAMPVTARDSATYVSLADAVARGKASGQLDGSVAFYLEGATTPAIKQKLGDATVNRKTNAVGKSDEEACHWVAMGALVALQEAAKQRGANAVVGMVSNYKKRTWSDPARYECHAGAIMAGVAFRGTYAQVAR